MLRGETTMPGTVRRARQDSSSLSVLEPRAAAGHTARQEARMNKGYGTFCPVAKAAEVLAERWTLLLMRDLLLGSRHFNDFRRALPPMSPGLISKRLQSLEAHGIVQRLPGGDARHPWQ